MKCPKCGYDSFDESTQCNQCGYQNSLCSSNTNSSTKQKFISQIPTVCIFVAWTLYIIRNIPVILIQTGILEGLAIYLFGCGLFVIPSFIICYLISTRKKKPQNDKNVYNYNQTFSTSARTDKIPSYQTNMSNHDGFYSPQFDNMDGSQFEVFCKDILIKNGFSNVTLTSGSGDHGVDILAEKDDISYAIQCKCYTNKIGNSAIQQAHTGKSIYNKDIAVVLTNNYFTKQAIDEAAVLKVKLWDRDKLLLLLKSNNKDEKFGLICPQCNSFLKQPANFCPYCRYDFRHNK